MRSAIARFATCDRARREVACAAEIGLARGLNCVPPRPIASEILMSRRPRLRHAPLALAAPPALDVLYAADWPQARAEAKRIIERGPHCRCCVGPRVHLTRFIGSTLFFDDDPEKLRLALPPGDRLTARVIAACIVLHGRERVELFPRT
jgi:hypothetical protein